MKQWLSNMLHTTLPRSQFVKIKHRSCRQWHNITRRENPHGHDSNVVCVLQVSLVHEPKNSWQDGQEKKGKMKVIVGSVRPRSPHSHCTRSQCVIAVSPPKPLLWFRGHRGHREHQRNVESSERKRKRERQSVKWNSVLGRASSQRKCVGRVIKCARQFCDKGNKCARV